MALRVAESFQSCAVADYALKYTATSGTLTNIAGRLVSGLRIGLAGYIAANLGAQATWIVGAAVRRVTAAGGNIFEFRDGGQAGTLQIQLAIDTSNRLQVQRNGTALGAWTTPLNLNVWYFIELKITINNTTGSYELRINGASVQTGSGLDTQNSANPTADTVLLGGSGAGTVEYCDWYVCDSTGAANNDFLGDIRCDDYRPNGAGNYSQWTATGAATGWQANDEATQNGDTDYATSATVGQKDSYTFTDTPLSGAIKGVIQTTWARKDDAGTRTVRQLCRTAGADYFKGNVNLGNSYLGIWSVWEQDPATAAAWTNGGLNAAEFGQDLVA